jgi:GAF domain-containing protein
LRDEVIGVIGIERAVSETADNDEESTGAAVWSEDEITTVRAITEQVTLALEAARLSQETQRAAWRDRVVGESTAKLWATDEIEEVMRAAVTQIGDQLKASEVVIRIGKEDDVPSE